MIFDALREVPKVVPTTARLFLAHKYETHAGIFNHDAPVREDDSLDLVRFHECEDTFNNSFMTERFQQYIDRGVFALTGIPFDRFIAQPRYQVLHQLKVCGQKQNQKHRVEKEVAAKMQEAGLGGS